MQPIRILHTLARSGGSVISRCLGCMDGVALLSEIHPLSQAEYGVKSQLAEWHGAEVGLGTFPEMIIKGAELVAPRALVIRWRDYVDRIPCYYNGWSAPLCNWARSALAGHDIVEAAIVRDPDPIWSSMAKHWGAAAHIAEGKLKRSDFDLGYASYLAMAERVGFVRYEDFMHDRAAMMRSLCEKLQLTFDSAFEQKWQSYVKVTGEIR